MPNGTMENLRSKEMVIFSAIPGMKELLQARQDTVQELEAQYPDAVFAIQVANNLFDHNRELSLITQKAYFGILDGEDIATVRFRYDKETTEYWKRHMWDD